MKKMMNVKVRMWQHEETVREEHLLDIDRRTEEFQNKPAQIILVRFDDDVWRGDDTDEDYITVEGRTYNLKQLAANKFVNKERGAVSAIKQNTDGGNEWTAYANTVVPDAVLASALRRAVQYGCDLACVYEGGRILFETPLAEAGRYFLEYNRLPFGN